MFNVAPIALPAEIYPDAKIHFQPVHNPHSQHLDGLLMVQFSQNPIGRNADNRQSVNW